MNDNPAPSPTAGKPRSLLHNWISLIGLVIAAGGFFSALCLLAMDFFAQFHNPYMGILTYFVAPFFLITGLILVATGMVIERRRLVRRGPGGRSLFPVIDLNRPAHRRALASLGGFAAVFLLLSAIGSYRSYHFTESKQFCGQTCHTVMKPEFTAYQNSPHARVTCTECHIGPGATWFVRSKLSGSYQVYATLFDKYPRPIPTPVKNLRPAQETCEQCHWPQKFYGAVEKVRTHFMYDEKNSPWTISLLLKVGGGDPAHGPVGGIHWHMNVANKVEYIASDEARQTIAWVRMTDRQGHVTEYQAKDTTLTPAQIAATTPRRMDCIDCHNRPTHIFHSPDESVDSSMALDRIDPSIPSIKKNAVAVLVGDYSTGAEAKAKIAEKLETDYAQYPDQTKIQAAITELQRIYRENFFPEDEVELEGLPQQHRSPRMGRLLPVPRRATRQRRRQNDLFGLYELSHHHCASPRTVLKTLSAQGLEFQHPAEELGDAWKGMKCSECHNGGLMQ